MNPNLYDEAADGLHAAVQTVSRVGKNKVAGLDREDHYFMKQWPHLLYLHANSDLHVRWGAAKANPCFNIYAHS